VSRGRGRAAVTGLGALLILLALLAGLPVLLYRLGGSPLPGHLPGASQVGHALLHRDSASIVLAAVRDVSWIAWALFTLAVLAEVQAVLRRRTAPRLRLGGMQTAAGRLVALAALTFTAAPVGTLLATAQPVSTVLQADVTAMPTSHFTVGPRMAPLMPPAPASTLMPPAPPSPPPAASTPAAAGTAALTAAAGTAAPSRAPRSARPEIQPGPAIPPPPRGPAAPGPGTGEWRTGAGARDSGSAATARPQAETMAAVTGTAAGAASGQEAGMDIIQLVTVRPGDCLWTIAQQHLGSGDQYHAIVALNQGHDMGNGQVFANPSLIQPGWVLHLPVSPPAAQPGGGAPGAGTPAPAPGGTHPGHPASSPPFSQPHPSASVTPSASPSVAPSAVPSASARPGSAPAAAPSSAVPSSAASNPARPAGGIPPPSPSGGPPGPAGSPAGQATPVSPVASIGPVQDSRLPLGLAFGTGVLAGGAAASLARLRHRQRQTRRRGRRIPVPASAPVAMAEQRLHVAAAQEPVTALRGVLSHLAAALVATPQQMPEISALLVQPDTLEILLASPAAEPPPPPFIVPGGRQGKAWQLWLDGDLRGIAADAAGDVGDLLPGLLTIGTVAGGYLLADLEHLQVTTVDGAASMTAAMLRSAAAELATGQLAGWYDLILVGFPELAALGGRGTCCDTLDAGLDLLTAKAVALRRRLGESPLADVRYHRLADPADEDWALTLLVSSVPPTSGQLALLSDLSADPGGIAALVPGGAEPSSGHRPPAVINMSAGPAGDGTVFAQLWPLQLEARPQALDDADYEALTSLFVTAAEAHDLSPADPPYDSWLWPPDLADGGTPGGPPPGDLAAGHPADSGLAPAGPGLDDSDPDGDLDDSGLDDSGLDDSGLDDGGLGVDGGLDEYAVAGDGLPGGSPGAPAGAGELGSARRLAAVPEVPDEGYTGDFDPAVLDGWVDENDWATEPVMIGDHWPAPDWGGEQGWAAGQGYPPGPVSVPDPGGAAPAGRDADPDLMTAASVPDPAGARDSAGGPDAPDGWAENAGPAADRRDEAGPADEAAPAADAWPDPADANGAEDPEPAEPDLAEPDLAADPGGPAGEPGFTEPAGPAAAGPADRPADAADPAVTGLPGAPAAWLSEPPPAAGPPAGPAGDISAEPEAEPAAVASVPDQAPGGAAGASPPAASAEASLRIGVLGTFTINGQPGALLPAQSQLVLALALNGTSGLSNQQLCYLLGADPDRPKPSDSLRQLIVRTRRQLGRAPGEREWIEHLGGGQYALHPAARFDWHEFDALTTEGMRSRDAGRLRRALGLIRGRPFTGCYYWWLDLALTETVRAQIVDAADVLAALELAAGDPAAAARAARLGLAGDAGAEPLWGALMRAEHAAGNLSGVREAWSRCLDAISEIAPDGEPHPGTAAVYRELLGDAPARPAWAGG
jgi:DNA-binding SARP family transcriptional activator